MAAMDLVLFPLQGDLSIVEMPVDDGSGWVELKRMGSSHDVEVGWMDQQPPELLFKVRL